MNKETINKYRLNTAAMLYRNIFESKDEYEKVSKVLEILETLICSGVIISPSMSFKLDKESDKYERFDTNLIEAARKKKELYVDYNGITIPAVLMAVTDEDKIKFFEDSKDMSDMEFVRAFTETLVDSCNMIILCVVRTLFEKESDQDIEIYVRPKVVDYISRVDYQWDIGDYDETLSKILEITETILNKFKAKKQRLEEGK